MTKFVELSDLRENLRVTMQGIDGQRHIGNVLEIATPQFRIYWDDGIITNCHVMDLDCMQLQAVKELPKKVLTKKEIYTILLENNDFTASLKTLRKIEQAVIAKYAALLENDE